VRDNLINHVIDNNVRVLKEARSKRQSLNVMGTSNKNNVLMMEYL